MTLSAHEHQVLDQLEQEFVSPGRRVLGVLRRAAIVTVGLVVMVVGMLLDNVAGEVLAVVSFVAIVGVLGGRYAFHRWP